MKNLSTTFLFVALSFFAAAQTFTIQQSTTGNPAVPIRGQSFMPSSQGTGTGSTGTSNNVVLKSFSIVYHIDATSQAAKMYLYSAMPSNATTLTDGTGGTLIAESISKTDNFPYTVYSFDNIKLNKNTTYYALFREDVALESGSGTAPGPYAGGQLVRNNTGTLALLTTADLRMTATFEQFLEPEIGVFYSATGEISGNGGTTLFGGTVYLNQVGNRTLTIKNTGVGTLTLGTVTASGTGISVSTQPAATVAPGSSTTFVLSYSSSVEAHLISNVSIPTNDADESIFLFKYDVVFDYPIVKPQTPFAISTRASQISIFWENHSIAEQFSIERSLSSSSGFAEIGTVPSSQLQYDDNTVTNGVTYYYRIRGKKSNGDVSGYSSVTSAIATYTMVGEWENKAAFPGVDNKTLRRDAAGFAIGDKGYMGLGYNFYDDQKDFWEYDPATNAWTRKTDFEGAARESAVEFVMNGKAYVGLGMNRATSPFTYMKDFYVYDPATDDWSPIATFPGQARSNAAAFVVNGKAYVGGGYGGGSFNFSDFYEYDPIANSWRTVASAPFVPGASNASGFAVGSKGYVFVGQNFYTYDPAVGATGTWTQKANLLFSAYGASTFVLNNKGYVVGGQDIRTNQQYDPVTNTWTLKTPYSGVASSGVIGFTIGNEGYVGMGEGYSSNKGELWSYNPVSPKLASLTAQIERNKITLSWVDNSDNETGYVLERGVATSSQTFPQQYTSIKTFTAGQLTYTDTDVNSNIYYVYRMRTKFPEGESLNKTLRAAIEYPSALQVQRTSETQLSLSWSPVASSPSYIVEQATSSVLNQSVSVFSQVGSPTSPSQTITVLSDAFFYYRVKATNALYSDTVNILVLKSPSNLHTSELSNTSVTLNWSDNSVMEMNYVIERKGASDLNYVEVQTTAADVTTYTDTNVEENVSYQYRVKAKRDAYSSYYSNGINVNVPAETVTGTEDFVAGLLGAYPNPAEDVLMVSALLNKGIHASQAKVVTANGVAIPVQSHTTDETVVFHVGDLPQGLYLLTLPGDKQVYKFRFIKK